MDSLTHIALGACIGEAFFEKGFGKKAMLWGALAQSIPDIDFVAGTWLHTCDQLMAHRGFTHSLLFSILIVPLFALTANKIHFTQNIYLRKWILFFSAEVLLHLFIDGFNNYGVGWLEPFSHTRFSFNTIFVADPFFSIWPGIACCMLFVLNRFSTKRTFWWKFGLLLPFLYLGYCSVHKIKMDHDVNQIFAAQNIPHERYFTTPAAFNNWLWYVVAGNEDGYHVGFRSVYDSKKEINFHYFPKNDSLLNGLNNKDDLAKLIRFSQQFYTIEKWHDTLVLNDLRFGQINGWKNPAGRFAFHYFLQYPDENKLVVQRGRFAEWDWQTVKELLQRIKGN